MKTGSPFALAALLLCLAGSVHAGGFSFGVIAPPRGMPDDMPLSEAIAEADEGKIAFLVANGVKSGDEPCSDDLYQQRKNLLNEARTGLILSLTAADWAGCRRRNGRTAALDRLNRMRDLFFGDEFSLGAGRIPVIRQSATPKFRANGENARWEIGGVLFATINLPANNNHYLPDAGRNSEFEDRAIANRFWLNRLFKVAVRQKLKGLVLFCDGDPLTVPDEAALARLSGRRDGFLEIREQLQTLAARYSGTVLVVHGARPDTGAQAARGRIAWRRNLGNLEIGPGWTRLSADPASPKLFSVSSAAEVARNAHH